MTSASAAIVSALVLAGKRDGALDPLAAEAKVSHKCLVPVGGRPMLLHPIAALAASPIVGTIYVSIDEPDVLAGVPELEELRRSGRLEMVVARPNLVDSVLGAAEGADFPLLVTTADNVLLTRGAVAEFARVAHREQADAAAGFARKETVLAAHPDGQRKFYEFRCGAYSNCNIYWIASRKALAAAEVFRSGGQFVKHPARIVGAFGLINLIRFRFGLGTLDGSFRRFSRRLKLSIRPVIIAEGEVAIDVDNPRTKRVAEEIMAQKRSGPENRAAPFAIDRSA